MNFAPFAICCSIRAKELPMKKLNVGLSLAAGLLGGLLSHYASTPSVHAQSLAPVPKEVRAQSFVLIDDRGVVQGIFSVDESKQGPAGIKLLDARGHEIWRAGGNGLRFVRGNSDPR
jgi:hypothetical protein